MTSACVMLTYVSLGTRILDPYPTPSLVMDPESPTFNKFISRAPVLSGALGSGGPAGAGILLLTGTIMLCYTQCIRVYACI